VDLEWILCRFGVDLRTSDRLLVGEGFSNLVRHLLNAEKHGIRCDIPFTIYESMSVGKGRFGVGGVDSGSSDRDGLRRAGVVVKQAKHEPAAVQCVSLCQFFGIEPLKN
jgi:hypothetical protein